MLADLLLYDDHLYTLISPSVNLGLHHDPMHLTNYSAGFQANSPGAAISYFLCLSGKVLSVHTEEELTQFFASCGCTGRRATVRHQNGPLHWWPTGTRVRVRLEKVRGLICFKHLAYKTNQLIAISTTTPQTGGSTH